MPKPILVLGLVVAAVLAGYWILLFLGQRSLLFPAPVVAGAPARPADAEQVWLAAAAGPTEAWLLPATTPGAAPRPLLIFTHDQRQAHLLLHRQPQTSADAVSCHIDLCL